MDKTSNMNTFLEYKPNWGMQVYKVTKTTKLLAWKGVKFWKLETWIDGWLYKLHPLRT